VKPCKLQLITFTVLTLAISAVTLSALPLAVVTDSVPSVIPDGVASSVDSSRLSSPHCLQFQPFPFGSSPLPSLLVQSSELMPAFSSHPFAAYVNVAGGSVGLSAVATFWKSAVGLGPGIFTYTSLLKVIFSLSVSYPLNGQRSVLVVSFAFVPTHQQLLPGTSLNTSLSPIYHRPPSLPLQTRSNISDSTHFSARGCQ
jgi:hypothetical protein